MVTCDSSAPQAARGTIGGWRTVDGGAAGPAGFAAYAAGASAGARDSRAGAPGSTRLTLRPSGRAARPVTRAWTPSEGPTHSGAEPVPSAPAVSRCRQALHRPEPAARVRTSAVPSSARPAPSQAMPSSENRAVDVRGSSRRPVSGPRSARSRTAAGRGERASAAGGGPPAGSAVAYVTAPAPPTTTAPIVSHALRRRLSGR
ncbi:hypothetical protein [Streptomyces sp. G45]|uniref:hypothetical protein n=1 Tax=Streptomyces sp. G45 TaxID=3406627 RepID=UPI003C2933A2